VDKLIESIGDYAKTQLDLAVLADYDNVVNQLMEFRWGMQGWWGASVSMNAGQGGPPPSTPWTGLPGWALQGLFLAR
jgi:hypothetical protein